MTDTRDALMVARTSDGRTVRRPLSPHLQIYKPQITSAMSIFHRFTGVALSVGTLLLVWWLAAAATSDAAFATASGFIGSWFGILLLIGWTVALVVPFLLGAAASVLGCGDRVRAAAGACVWPGGADRDRGADRGDLVFRDHPLGGG